MVVGAGDVGIRLRFEDEQAISALDLSAFIFDNNRIYVAAVRFSNDEPGGEVEFRGFGRNSYRVPRATRLNVARIRFESPGLIEVATSAAAAASALWLIVQSFEKLNLWRLNRRKLQLEIQKLERDLGVQPQRLRRERLEPFLSLPEVRSAANQLEKNPLKPVGAEVVIGSDAPRDRR